MPIVRKAERQRTRRADPTNRDEIPDGSVGSRIARRLLALRSERGFSLEALSEHSGISRATLSRIGRAELSATAAMLGRLCSVYGWTLSRLMAEVEAGAPSLVPGSAQTQWEDPESGYRRRVVSPPTPGLRGELVKVRMPAGAAVAFDATPIAGLEHHLWLLAGALELELDGRAFELRAGDCLRYVLNGPSRFRSVGRSEARYVIALVHP